MLFYTYATLIYDYIRKLSMNTTIVDSGLKDNDHVYVESSMFQVGEGKEQKK